MKPARMPEKTLFAFTAFVASWGASSCGRSASDDATAAGVASARAALGSCSGDWSQMPSPNVGGGDNSLASVAGSAADDVWAVGQVAPDANPNITLTLALHFDGTAWSVVDTPNAGRHANALLAVAAAGGTAWAVGYDIGPDFLSHSLIEAWDGRAWRVVAHPQPFDTENLYGVAATSPSDVWAVGSGRDGEGAFHTLVLHFDGRRWTVVPSADPGSTGNVLYGVVATAPDDAWAVGQAMGDAPPDRALVEHWDGASWSAVSLGAGAPSTQLLAVDEVAGDDVRAVGDAQDGVVSLRTFALSSEGARFSLQPTANPNVGDNRLTGVAATSDDQTFAVGSTLDDVSGGLETLIVSGSEDTTWARVSSPNPSADGDNQLAAVTEVGRHDLWAVGAFDGPDAAQTLILHRCR